MSKVDALKKYLGDRGVDYEHEDMISGDISDSLRNRVLDAIEEINQKFPTESSESKWEISFATGTTVVVFKKVFMPL